MTEPKTPLFTPELSLKNACHNLTLDYDRWDRLKHAEDKDYVQTFLNRFLSQAEEVLESAIALLKCHGKGDIMDEKEVHRSAESGRSVSEEEAKAHPETTVKETIPITLNRVEAMALIESILGELESAWVGEAPANRVEYLYGTSFDDDIDPIRVGLLQTAGKKLVVMHDLRQDFNRG